MSTPTITENLARRFMSIGDNSTWWTFDEVEEVVSAIPWDAWPPRCGEEENEPSIGSRHEQGSGD